MYFDRESHDKLQEVVLLATGSSDNRIYLHDVSMRHNRPSARNQTQSTLVQRIDAHSDRVYCVDFHPNEPILASASADFTVKIWVPRSTTRISKSSS